MIRGPAKREFLPMMRRLVLRSLLFILLIPAAAHAQSTMQIAVIGKGTVANTAAYGTVVDSLFAINSQHRWIRSGVTWSVSNPDFFVDPGGALHTAWSSIIAPGPQTMTITAAAAGYTTATMALTVTVTGTLAPQTMVVTPTQVATVYDNLPQNSVVYSLTVSQSDGTLGNLSGGVSWASDNPLFAVTAPNTNSGIYYLVTTWSGTIADGTQTVDLTASAPGYTTATLTLTISVVSPADATMTVTVNGTSSAPDNAMPATVIDTLSATDPNGAVIPGAIFSVDNPNFQISGGNLVTAWLGTIADGPQTVNVTATAPGFQTTTLPLTVTIVAGSAIPGGQ
jgi:hypothetical protein